MLGDIKCKGEVTSPFKDDQVARNNTCSKTITEQVNNNNDEISRVKSASIY